MKKIVTLLAVVVGLTSFMPKAEAHAGFYIGPLGGANWLQTNKKSHHHDGSSEEDFGSNLEVDFNTGYYVGGFLGYEFCSGLSVEAEFTYRHNTIRKIKAFDESFKAHGKFWSMSYMANVLYDIHLNRWLCLPITPYIGAGIGYEQQRLKLGRFHGEGKKNGFAWQVLAGIGYDITPCFDVALDYRFNEGRARRIYNHSLGVRADYVF